MSSFGTEAYAVKQVRDVSDTNVYEGSRIISSVVATSSGKVLKIVARGGRSWVLDS
jgi:hypothetical protein